MKKNRATVAKEVAAALKNLETARTKWQAAKNALEDVTAEPLAALVLARRVRAAATARLASARAARRAYPSAKGNLRYVDVDEECAADEDDGESDDSDDVI